MKRGVTVVKKEKEQLISIRSVMECWVCVYYQHLNSWIEKYHFPMSFMDQLLVQFTGKSWYCFLDGYSEYNQISISPKDLEKTIFTCPYGTFAFNRMSFGLYNALATFQIYMLSFFAYMIEDSMKVFIDDFSAVGDTFEGCLV